jgi:hypothetical protein
MNKKGKCTRNLTKYEMERMSRIKQKQERMNALKLKKLAASMDSSQSKGAHGKKKRISVEVLSTDDGDSDNESSNSFMHEVLHVI